MNKKIFLQIFNIILCLSLPLQTLAASLGFVLSANKIEANDVFVVELRLSAGSEKINAIDGELQFDPSILSVEEISTGGSIFSIWARAPIFSNESGRIIFAGGAPNGIKDDGTVFKIIFTAKESGVANFNVSPNTFLYLNDGLGTIVKPTLNSGELEIQPGSTGIGTNAWQQEINLDKNSPADVFLILGRDASIFDNKYFLTITASDQESGIDHFEVKEGDRDFVYSESPYVLQDQSLKSKVVVKVIDKAGNVTLSQYDPKSLPQMEVYKWLVYLLIVILAILALVIVIKIKNKNTPKSKNVSKRKTKSTK